MPPLITGFCIYFKNAQKINYLIIIVIIIFADDDDDDDQLTNENHQHIIGSTEQQLFSDPAVTEKPSHQSSVIAKRQSRDHRSVYPNYGFVSDKSSLR